MSKWTAMAIPFNKAQASDHHLDRNKNAVVFFLVFFFEAAALSLLWRYLLSHFSNILDTGSPHSLTHVHIHWGRLHWWNHGVAGAGGKHSIIAFWIENEVGVIARLAQPCWNGKPENECSMSAGRRESTGFLSYLFPKMYLKEKTDGEGLLGACQVG